MAPMKRGGDAQRFPFGVLVQDDPFRGVKKALPRCLGSGVGDAAMMCNKGPRCALPVKAVKACGDTEVVATSSKVSM
jgi:hypothetical protein